MQLNLKSLLANVSISIRQQLKSESHYLWICRILCCFGFVLFFLASSLVLSLIPIYLPQHGTTSSITRVQSELFYIEYKVVISENSTDIYSGFVGNLGNATDELTQRLGLRSNIISIKQIQLIEQIESGRRQSREVIIKTTNRTNTRLLISCQANYRVDCRSEICRKNYISQIRQRFSKQSNIILSLNFISSFPDQIIQFTLQYVNFTFNLPSAFSVISSTSNSIDEWVSIVNPITLSLKAAELLLNSGGYALISAGRNPSIPSDVNLSDEVIQQRTDNLTADLKNIFLYTSILGVYDGNSETSFFVMLHNKSPDQERAAFMALGAKYNQDSIIYVKKTTPTIQELIYTTGKYKGKYVRGQGYEKLLRNQTDNYSKLQTCPNGSYTFTLNFDFETMITGRAAIQTLKLIEHHANNRFINQKRFTS